MELTRFDLKNQAIQERIAVALERIAATLPGASTDKKIVAYHEREIIVEAYTVGFNTARGIEGDTDAREVKKTFDQGLQKCLKNVTTKNRS